MTQTRFTPGPWVIDPETRPAEVCTVHGMPSDERTNWQGWAYVRGALGHWSADEDEEMANAHLIAAAPDLYEALADLIDAFDGEPGFGPARDALAKARGES